MDKSLPDIYDEKMKKNEENGIPLQNKTPAY